MYSASTMTDESNAGAPQFTDLTSTDAVKCYPTPVAPPPRSWLLGPNARAIASLANESSRYVVEVVEVEPTNTSDNSETLAPYGIAPPFNPGFGSKAGEERV